VAKLKNFIMPSSKMSRRKLLINITLNCQDIRWCCMACAIMKIVKRP